MHEGHRTTWDENCQNFHSFIIQGCPEKLFFFTNQLHKPIPRPHIAPKFSLQCECTDTYISWSYYERLIAAQCWRGRGGKIQTILEKKHIFFLDHPDANSFDNDIGD